MAEVIYNPDQDTQPQAPQEPLYSLAQWEADLQKIKPRAFDTYVLPGFMMYAAIRSRKGLGKLTRRILFVAGVYMVYRNWQTYKNALAMITQKPEEKPQQLPEERPEL